VEGAHTFSGIGPVRKRTLVRFVAKELPRAHGEGRSDYNWRSGDVWLGRAAVPIPELNKLKTDARRKMLPC
jgi:hypothetical protein